MFAESKMLPGTYRFQIFFRLSANVVGRLATLNKLLTSGPLLDRQCIQYMSQIEPTLIKGIVLSYFYISFFLYLVFCCLY